jgi:hypothetical protein
MNVRILESGYICSFGFKRLTPSQRRCRSLRTQGTAGIRRELADAMACEWVETLNAPAPHRRLINVWAASRPMQEVSDRDATLLCSGRERAAVSDHCDNPGCKAGEREPTSNPAG